GPGAAPDRGRVEAFPDSELTERPRRQSFLVRRRGSEPPSVAACRFPRNAPLFDARPARASGQEVQWPAVACQTAGAVRAEGALMQFAIFGSAQAGAERPGAAPGEGFHEFAELCVEAEALGYRATFLVEHHFTGWDQVSATLQLLTWVAARTATLRLGTAVLVLPWHNPVLLAEQAATLDLMSGGRLDLGAGKGDRHTRFGGVGLPP